jgi:hypothetical protein
MSCKREGATHYHGCECWEAVQAGRIRELEEQVKRQALVIAELNGEIEQLRIQVAMSGTTEEGP